VWNDTLDKRVYSPAEEKFFKNPSEKLNDLKQDLENGIEDSLPKS
jgi:hypothetical protein